MHEDIKFLKTFYIFKNFSDRFIQDIYYLSKKIEFNKGKFIIKQGDNPDYIYLIRSGECKVIISNLTILNN